MSNRLDQDREKELQPIRMKETKKALEDLGFKVEVFGETRLEFMLNGNKISFYPYSGWHSGKGIKDGRGFNKLKNQLINNSK